tara:strand:- start:6229 stop:6798 length:570 start_codon:yes stop_codon:yes gene_type:complete
MSEYNSNGIQKALYTPGGEYLLNGEDYIGYYHIHPDKGAMVGKVHVNTPHERLVSVEDNPLITGYKIAYQEETLPVSQTTKLPFTYMPNPSDEDFEEGFIVRYFIAKRNDYNKIFETSEREYPKKLAGLASGLYQEVEVIWHITRKLETEGLLDFSMTTESKNRQEVEIASEIVPSVKSYLSDLTQFSS